MEIKGLGDGGERKALPTESPPDLGVLLPSSPRRKSSTSHGKLNQALGTFVACMTCLNLGCVFGYSSPVMSQLIRQGHLTRDQVPWFGSIITLGAAAGGPLGGFLLGFSGRKMTILYCSAAFAISWLFILLGGLLGYISLYLGRFIAGLGVGMVSAAVPVFISEIAQPEIRGALTGNLQLSSTFGVMMVYGLGIIIDWQWLAVFGVALALLSLLFMLPFPDTPRYLMSQGDKLGADESLCFYRSSDKDIDSEYKAIEKASKEEKMTNSSMTLCQLFSSGYWRPVVICSILMVFNQLNGPTPLWFFISTIFAESGYKGPDAVPPLVVSGTAVIGVIISIPLMDRCGRRLLLIIGSVMVGLSSAAMGVHFYIAQQDIKLDWLPVTSLSLFILGFYVGIATPPYALMAESFPVSAQSMASGICILVAWFSAFIYSALFLDLLNVFTPYGTFWLISGIAIVHIIFVICFVTETKQKSLQQISGGTAKALPLDDDTDV